MGIKTEPHIAPGGVYPNLKLLREFLSYDMRFDLLSVIKDKGESEPRQAGFAQIDQVSTGHWSRQYELPWAIEATNLEKTDIVLDAGCGYSALKFALAKRCKKVYGIDLSIPSLREARHMCAELELENVELMYADISTFKTDLLFDKIFCISVLEHGLDSDSILNCITNMKSLLKPGGSLIISLDLALDRLIENFNIDVRLAMEILAKLDFSFEQIDKIHELRNCRVATLYDMNGHSSTICVLCCVYHKPMS